MAKSKKNETKTKPNNYLRNPVVTLMGHVDHGKTSILDAIRSSRITASESGGITQHIGAYTVEKDGKKITFIDTPGHEAFTQMRARGGAAADIVIIVVAADDGVMPQTKEAIMHARASGVPIIVAINKVDLPGANIPRVKQQLAENDILVEGYGGDIVAVEVSALKGTGIDELLEVINLISEMDDSRLKVDPEGKLNVQVIESRKDQKRGIIVAGIVKNGTLRIKDEVVTASAAGRVRAMTNSQRKSVIAALPGDAVEILGFSDTPSVGEIIYNVADNPEFTPNEAVGDSAKPQAELVRSGDQRMLNLVVRADTVGTQEALVSSLNKLSVDDAKPNIIFAGTGDVKESDVLLASTSKAVIVAFKVGVPTSVSDIAEIQKVIIREYEIIYKLLEEIEGALQGVLEIEEAKIKGRGLIIEKFVLPKSGMVVAGTLVEAGKFKLNNRVGVFRDEEDTPRYVARIRTMHVGPNEVETVSKGNEVGLLFKPPLEDVQLDDRIEVL